MRLRLLRGDGAAICGKMLSEPMAERLEEGHQQVLQVVRQTRSQHHAEQVEHEEFGHVYLVTMDMTAIKRTLYPTVNLSLGKGDLQVKRETAPPWLRIKHAKKAYEAKP